MMSCYLVILLTLFVSFVSCNDITDEEIKTFTSKLLPLDVNNVAHLIKVDLQEKATKKKTDDPCSKPLLTVPKNALDGVTISKLLALTDNYEKNVTIKETTTDEEIREDKEFLDAILKTSIMNSTRKFFSEKGLIDESKEDFRDTLKRMWFEFYKRSGDAAEGSSCGLEHVLSGEMRKKKNKPVEVLGVHNWINFHMLEKKGDIDYKGYMKSVALENNKGWIISLRFSLDDVTKPISSMFIGTSPELELAYYTVCFLARKNKICSIQISKNIIVNIQTNSSDKANVATAYPRL